MKLFNEMALEHPVGGYRLIFYLVPVNVFVMCNIVSCIVIEQTKQKKLGLKNSVVPDYVVVGLFDLNWRCSCNLVCCKSFFLLFSALVAMTRHFCVFKYTVLAMATFMKLNVLSKLFSIYPVHRRLAERAMATFI